MILYGASGHCKVIIDILEANGVPIDFIVDDNPQVLSLLGYEVRRNSGQYNEGKTLNTITYNMGLCACA